MQYRYVHPMIGATSAPVGGKAAHLASMAASGLPVPHGFFVGYNALADSLERARLATPVTAEAVATMTVDATVAAEVQQELARLATSYGEPCLLAVRSSAAREDGAERSYAGQYTSVLQVEPDGVLDAMRQVWASAFGALVRAYGQRGVTDTPTDVAVIVQRMLKPLWSAVVYTRNPSGDEDDVVVDAVKGLGADLCAGTATGATYAIRRESRRIRWWQPGAAESFGDALPPLVLERLVDVALKAEQVCGFAADVEAAFADGQWWLLQARPISVSGIQRTDPLRLDSPSTSQVQVGAA